MDEHGTKCSIVQHMDLAFDFTPFAPFHTSALVQHGWDSTWDMMRHDVTYKNVTYWALQLLHLTLLGFPAIWDIDVTSTNVEQLIHATFDKLDDYVTYCDRFLSRGTIKHQKSMRHQIAPVFFVWLDWVNLGLGTTVGDDRKTGLNRDLNLTHWEERCDKEMPQKRHTKCHMKVFHQISHFAWPSRIHTLLSLTTSLGFRTQPLSVGVDWQFRRAEHWMPADPAAESARISIWTRPGLIQITKNRNRSTKYALG